MTHDKKPTGRCKHCDGTFFLQRYWQKFCSYACKKAYEKIERKQAYEALRKGR